MNSLERVTFLAHLEVVNSIMLEILRRGDDESPGNYWGVVVGNFHGLAVRFAVALLASAVFTAGTTLIDPSMASAQACVGLNERTPLDLSDVSYSVKVDSCKAQELVDAYGDAKDASGLGGALGAKWWPVGVVGGVFFAWAWNNQAAVKEAAAPGRGVEFLQVNGIITQARPQA